MTSINPSSGTGAQNDNQSTARKAWLTALETRFEQAQPRLNTSRKQLIRSIIENAEDNYFLSSRALAKQYSVDVAAFAARAGTGDPVAKMIETLRCTSSAASAGNRSNWFSAD